MAHIEKQSPTANNKLNYQYTTENCTDCINQRKRQ